MNTARFLLLTFIAGVAVSRASNLVVDPGFEQATAGSTSAPGWTLYGGAVAPGSNFHYGNTIGPPGVQSGGIAALFGGGDNCTGDLAADDCEYDTIYQTIPTAVGGLYEFSFYLAGEWVDPIPNGQVVQWGSTVVLNLTDFGQEYVHYVFDEVATTSNTTIYISGFNAEPVHYNGVDDVDVHLIPEPATFLLLAPGLCGLAVLRRKFRR